MTASILNQRIVLAKRPTAAAMIDDFRIESVPVPELKDGEVLLRTIWLSLDPYMRGRMSDAPSYAAPVAIGEVMIGGTVSQIESSRHPGFRAGELVLGMPGFTAYMGLTDIGKPQAGETVVVAAATGAVGSVVGQVAKIRGCRVVGIAGGAQKCAWAVEELGFDACIDHRSAELPALLAAACPAGVDVYFENVGGKVFQAVLPLLNTHARIPVCGLIAHYQTGAAASIDLTPALMRSILVKRLTLRGFIIFDDYGAEFPQFRDQMSKWLYAGLVKYREDVVDGLGNAPRAFLGLLEGRNFGKLVVKVGA